MRFGETAGFKIKLSNPGNGPAENVAVNVGASGAASQPNTVGTLGAGESRIMEVELTAKQAGTMKIQASAQGDGELRADATHDVRVRRAQLAVKVTAPTLVYAGATATYEIRVANTGDAVAEGVTLEVQLPAGNKNAVGVDKKPLTADPPRWRLGELPPGSDRVYTMQCDLVTGGQSQFVARVQAKDDNAASDTATTTVEAIADLKLVVNDPQGPLPVGKEVTYEIQIVNRGSREANNIDVVAQFSEGIEPSTAAGHRSEIVPGQVIFEPIRSLPAGGQVTLKITAKAAEVRQPAIPRGTDVQRAGDETRNGRQHAVLRIRVGQLHAAVGPTPRQRAHTGQAIRSATEIVRHVERSIGSNDNGWLELGSVMRIARSPSSSRSTTWPTTSDRQPCARAGTSCPPCPRW